VFARGLVLDRRQTWTTWARVATLMAGRGRGTWFVPEIGDEVLVAFEAGDPKRPYVLGSLWNRPKPPPATMDASNTRTLVRSRNGLTISIEDADGAEGVSIATPGGQQITLQDGPGAIVIKDGNGNAIELATAGVRIAAASSVSIFCVERRRLGGCSHGQCRHVEVQRGR
jgi:uncharacterized protein involved in type VI secretion and phage assembly